ncbi:MAG: J domain-containing protein [Acidimicrobiia bacterium]
MTPHEVLGVSPQASKAEVVAAYRTLVQIFHPDRFNDSPPNVRAEAERRMKQLNDAYSAIRSGGSFRSNTGPVWTPPPKPKPRAGASASATASAPPRARVPWDISARARAAQAMRAEQERRAREEAAPNGSAVAKPKSGRTEQSVLSGLGEALVSNRMPCHRCESIQWFPEGWREQLQTTDYYCSICSALLLRR